MNQFFIGLNLQRNFLFGFAWDQYMFRFGICFGCFSIEVYPNNFRKGQLFSFWNEFAQDKDCGFDPDGQWEGHHHD